MKFEFYLNWFKKIFVDQIKGQRDILVVYLLKRFIGGKIKAIYLL